MRIVVACDSFKGTLTAAQACEAVAAGLGRALSKAEVVVVPMADGGEGTVAAIVSSVSGRYVEAVVRGPLGDPVQARYGLIEADGCGVIEMAAASGVLLVRPDQRDVMRASTFGTGQLISRALDDGAQRLLIGIGGSATNDAGCGMAQAVGVRFLDADGAVLADGLGGGDVDRIQAIDMGQVMPALRSAAVEVCCDVTNPLTGPNGAAHVYARQKGATDRQIEVLDRNLAHLARIIERDLGVTVADIPGAGAAGGLGAGLMVFAGGRLVPGVEQVIEWTGLAERCAGADAIITGEGRLDAQSFQGKVVSGVGAVGRGLGVTVYVIAGAVTVAAEEWGQHFAGVAAVADSPVGQESDSYEALVRRTEAAARHWFNT